MFTTPTHATHPIDLNHATHLTARGSRRRGFGRPALAVGAGVVTLAMLGACGADDDGMPSAACDAYTDAQGAFFGDPAAIGPAFQTLADSLDGDLADDAGVLATAAASDDPAAFESPDVAAASERLGDAAFDGCDTVAAVDVHAVDYAFADLPAQVDAGRVAFRIANESDSGQPHEMVIVTGTDGQPADELRDLPMDELMAAARPVAVAFADRPDTRATTMVDLAPGSYLVICTLPVADAGSAPDPDAPPTDTHADHGMVATLTVV